MHIGLKHTALGTANEGRGPRGLDLSEGLGLRHGCRLEIAARMVSRGPCPMS